MPRTARIDIPNQWYHIIARGQRQDKIFLDKEDYYCYIKFLNDFLTKKNLYINAFCLMPNHVHILVYRKNVPLWEIFKSVHTKYAIYFNKKYDKKGYVFQGRFKSLLVTNERYLITLLNYIHLNPYRANLCSYLSDYLFSSYNFYIYNKNAFDLNLCKIKNIDISLLKKNINFDSDKLEELINLKDNYIGTDLEYNKIEKRIKERDKKIKKDRRHQAKIIEICQKNLNNPNINIKELFREKKISRIIKYKILRLLYDNNYKTSEIAKFFNIDKSTVSYYLKE